MEICKRSGYDNALAFLDFNESDLKILENFAEENLQELVKETDAYSEVKPFAFLPGHRKLLIGLPNKIADFKNRKSKKNLFKTSKIEARAPYTEEVVEILTETEISKLKESLLQKINVCLLSIGLDSVFTETNLVSEFEIYISNTLKKLTKPSYKVLVKCILCDKRIPCTHNSHWQICNLDKHIKTHMNLSTTANIAPNKENSTNIQHIINQTEVHSMLGLTEQINNDNIDENQSSNDYI